MGDLIDLLRLQGKEVPDPERYRGVLLGVAVGNALGIRAEGWSAEEIRRLLGRITEISPIERTTPWDDDVAQAVILAEAILEHDRLDIDDLGSRFLDWFGATPRGIGLQTAQVMRELAKGTPASDASRLVWEWSGRDAAGNGPVMRCWPVALRWHRFPERLISEARTSALITHHDPRCEWSTVASVTIATLALADRPFDAGALAAAMDAFGAPMVVAEALRASAGASLEDLHLDDDSSMGYTLKAMQVAAWCASQEPDIEQVVEAVVNAGGDTDTNGAVAGAIMGARVGANEIPARWGESVARGDDLLDLADRLHAASRWDKQQVEATGVPSTRDSQEQASDLSSRLGLDEQGRVQLEAVRPCGESSSAGAMIAEKYRGAILGVAIGDALGSVYEGTPRPAPQEIQYLLSDLHDLRYTDDTAMTIAMAESLIACSALDQDHMAETLAAAYWAEPGRGTGGGPAWIFEEMMNGKSWRHVAAALYDGGSYGNGGAMRVSPAALFAAPDLEAVAAIAAGSARITHTHPLGVEGAEHQAIAVALALASDAGIPLNPTAFIETLLSRVRSEEFHTALRVVAELIPSGERDEAVHRVGHGVRAVQAVPVAIWCFLRNPESFVDTALCAISVGGDTDTITSMACAISGARLGESAIPEIWRVRIEGRAKLQSIADALTSVASRSGTRSNCCD
jgi:poly(ADP-ribose) glycohydrolase ARH3